MYDNIVRYAGYVGSKRYDTIWVPYDTTWYGTTTVQYGMGMVLRLYNIAWYDKGTI